MDEVMGEAEFKALQATFPWSHVTIRTSSGMLFRVVDNRGAEVSIPTMVRFLEVITAKLAAKQKGE